MIPFKLVRTGIDVIVSLTVGAIVEDTAKLLTPKNTKALMGWSIRIGSSVVGSVIGGATSYILLKQIDAIKDKISPSEEDPTTVDQEDN